MHFLTIQWNLKSRSEATENISFGQLKWENDQLKVYFAKHKSDQIGLNKDEAKYTYSNPKDPAVCPIQALASYLLVFPEIFINGNKVFLGNDQKKGSIPIYIDFFILTNVYIKPCLSILMILVSTLNVKVLQYIVVLVYTRDHQ